MMFRMTDGTAAHLVDFIQSSEYREGYRTGPPDPHAECLRLAAYHVPAQWRTAPLIFVWPEEYGPLAGSLFVSGKLPKILCIGRFLSYRPPPGVHSRVSYLHVAWVQGEFQPHIGPENLRCLEALDWEVAERAMAKSGESAGEGLPMRFWRWLQRAWS